MKQARNLSSRARAPRQNTAFRLHVELLEDRNAPGEVLSLAALSLGGLGLGLFDGDLTNRSNTTQREQQIVSLLGATNSHTQQLDTGLRVVAPSSTPAAPLDVVGPIAIGSSTTDTLLFLSNAIPGAFDAVNFDSGEWSLEQKLAFQRDQRGLFDLDGNAITAAAFFDGSLAAGLRGSSGGLHAPFAVSPGNELYRALQFFASNWSNGGGVTSAATVRLLVDTDRNGVVDDNDEDGKGTWTRDRGALYMVNMDDDDGDRQPDAVNFNDTGRPFNENKVIENDADVYDMAPLVIKALGAEFDPGSMQVYLFTYSPTGSAADAKENAQAIHVFPYLATGAPAIFGGVGDRVVGGAPEAEIVDVTPWVSADYDVAFGVEGLLFRNLAAAGSPLRFDGYVDLGLAVYQGVDLVGFDVVQMKVAPWMMLPHTQASREIWSADYGVQNASYHFNASAAPGYYGLDDSGQLQLITGVDRGTQWVQDHAETGYTYMPGSYPQQSHFRLPYFRGGPAQPAWGTTRMLRPDVGAFQIGVNLGASSGDYGGNVEILPPTAAHPLGRIIFGDTGSAALNTFFTSQEVQAPVRIPTRWLAVGHADETFGFSPSGQLVMGSTSKAYELMEAIPQADRGKSVFFATGRNPVNGSAGAGSTTTRLMVPGTDYTGTTWQFLRFYSGAAAGQVARIVGRGNGFLDVSTVWNTTSTLVGNTITDPSHWRWLYAANAPSRTGWFTTPTAGNQFVLVEGTRTWSGGGTPSIITVQEILADAGFRDLNLRAVAAKEAQIRSILETAAGGSGSLEIIEVPVLFVGNRGAAFDTGRTGVAFTPGAENFHALGDSLYIPRQYSPLDAAGNDIFETYMSSVLTNTKYVEDWDLYHRLLGEVHCGSVVMREPYAYDWWTAQP